MSLSSFFLKKKKLNANGPKNPKKVARIARMSVDELTTKLKSQLTTHDPYQAWQDLINSIEYCKDLLYFGSNQDSSPGGTVTKEDVANLCQLANSYMFAYTRGLLLLETKEVDMLRDVIASTEPSVFLVKMLAFCEYLRNKKNSEDTDLEATDHEESKKEKSTNDSSDDDSTDDSSDDDSSDDDSSVDTDSEESSEEECDEEENDVDNMEI